jgi:hypothetical protein
VRVERLDKLQVYESKGYKCFKDSDNPVVMVCKKPINEIQENIVVLLDIPFIR